MDGPPSTHGHTGAASKSGHFICSRERTDHELPRLANPALDTRREPRRLGSVRDGHGHFRKANEGTAEGAALMAHTHASSSHVSRRRFLAATGAGPGAGAAGSAA